MRGKRLVPSLKQRVPILSQINPLHNIIFCFYKIHFSVILLYSYNSS